MTKKRSHGPRKKKVWQQNAWDAKANSSIITAEQVSRYYKNNRFAPKSNETSYNPGSADTDVNSIEVSLYETVQNIDQTLMEKSLDTRLLDTPVSETASPTITVPNSIDSPVSEEYSPTSQKPGFFTKAVSRIPGKTAFSKALNYAANKVSVPGIPGPLAITLSSMATVVALTACGGGTSTPEYTPTPVSPTSTSVPMLPSTPTRALETPDSSSYGNHCFGPDTCERECSDTNHNLHPHSNAYSNAHTNPYSNTYACSNSNTCSHAYGLSYGYVHSHFDSYAFFGSGFGEIFSVAG